MAERVCPVWVGYLLASPVRKLFQNPHKLLGPYIKTGMKVLDIGCAMGFFSLPLARMVGPKGTVISVDLQEKMLKSLEKRARKAGLSDIIETRICGADSLGLDNLGAEMDFALASAVIHEVPDVSSFFSEVCAVLKQGGKLLVAEPKGHVSGEDFKRTVSAAEAKGFKVSDNSPIGRPLTVLLEKK